MKATWSLIRRHQGDIKGNDQKMETRNAISRVEGELRLRMHKMCSEEREYKALSEFEKSRRAMKKEVEKENCCEEFQDFGKLGLTNEIVSETQRPKTCQKTVAAAAAPADGLEICLEKSEVSDSKTSISACSCGPDCGPDKCEGRNRSVLVGWDPLRTKIFIFLFVAFLVWLLIYVPISLMAFLN